MPLQRVLAIDVGNSRIKAGVLTVSANAGELPRCDASTAFAVSQSDPADAIHLWLTTHSLQPELARIGGVNPSVIAAVTNAWNRELCPLTHVERPATATLENRTSSPERVGPDRLFDAVAANRLRPEGTPILIVDSGTATTVDLVDADGAFVGGAILAGFELVASALHERTALLPKVDVTELSPPPDPLGRETEAAIRSGLYWGLVGGVKELVDRLSIGAVKPNSPLPIVLLTGGAAPLLEPHLAMARVYPHLTLQGIVLSAL